MGFQLSVIPHTLRFRFTARTSRGAMADHKVWYFLLTDSRRPDVTGIGECAPLPGLSPDADYLKEGLPQFLTGFEEQNFQTEEELASYIQHFDGATLPSVKFALETALLDYRNGGNRLLFPSEFTQGEKPIPINGLIWMSDKQEMIRQIKEKLDKGFGCLKLKIGALDFEQELEVLRFIRQEYASQNLTIRVDANGAFTVAEAKEKLNRLSAYSIHSIEQPIKPGQWEETAKLSEESPIPVALDEELIGQQARSYKRRLLSAIKPPYLILKPTLVGGLQSAQEWIELAEEQQIGWWITSALESNIGLNAIAQFTAANKPEIPQGLGTGQLYHNNVPSPLRIGEGFLHFGQQQWDFAGIFPPASL